jgi:hypothetical protein
MGLAAPDYTGDPCSHELVGMRIAQIWTASVLIGGWGIPDPGLR